MFTEPLNSSLYPLFFSSVLINHSVNILVVTNIFYKRSSLQPGLNIGFSHITSIILHRFHFPRLHFQSTTQYPSFLDSD